MAVENKETPRSIDRADLVKRLFAIAISIGVGNTLVNAAWVRNGVWPAGHEIEQISIVLLALFATVLSWDGYLASVRKKPLNDWLRFAIDVFLVFIYMILLITSDKGWFWLPIICLMYVLYVFWDALSVVVYPATFDESYQEGTPPLRTLRRVYFLAIANARGIDRGPLISLMWTVYFVALWRLIWDVYPTYPVIPAVVLGAAGLAGYRLDKWIVRGSGVRGFSILERVLFILALVVSAFLYAHLTGIPRKV
jgi:hypothetical protein